jgi:hypothetical protein
MLNYEDIKCSKNIKIKLEQIIESMKDDPNLTIKKKKMIEFFIMILKDMEVY